MSDYPCGHPRTAENSVGCGAGRKRCKTCSRAAGRKRYAEPDYSLYVRVYHLPRQLERARARVRQLETEAVRLGLRDLVETAQ